MKIEKISDNQIRCTLSREDLANREINLSELAYATDKAKDLFRDMIQQANDKFGFDADNLPLMIEAIPIMPDSIILIITKVEDPEELDTRFSKFAPSTETENKTDLLAQMVGADDIIDLFKKLCEGKAKQAEEKKTSGKRQVKAEKEDLELIRVFEFFSLDDVIHAAGNMMQAFNGVNALYRYANEDSYQLILHQSGQSPEDFNRICNQLSEYARGDAFSTAGEAYLKEHAKCIISDQALGKLAQLCD